MALLDNRYSDRADMGGSSDVYEKRGSGMTEWRNELLKDMINAMYKVENMQCSKLLVMARAALAVAEPVIREQADNALREENARLRAALKPFAYIAEQVGDEDARWAVPSAHLRAAAAALKETGDE